jgi:general secretion pathway protein I
MRRGFTLLEVMVALALLAAALVAISDLCGNALRNHAYARDLSAATLLARGKMAELEQKYEDQGFKDFDEEEEGDFSDSGRPDMHWKLALVKPSNDLSAEQLMATLAGTTDVDQLMAMVLGGLGGGAAGTGPSSSGGSSGGPSGATAVGPLAGMVTNLLKTQLTTFGEIVKRSLREMRFTISWRDGAVPRGFTVTTHLLVLNPRAPNNARGDNPEVPPNLAATGAAQATPQQGVRR